MKKWIIENCLTTTGKINSRRTSEKWWKDLSKLNELIEYTSFLSLNVTIRERIYCIIHNIYKEKQCYCGKKLILGNIGYGKHCSSKCSNNSKGTKKLKRETFSINYERYDKIIKKRKQTNLERYGNENYNNMEQLRKTNLERRGVEYAPQSKEVMDVRIISNLKKYGVEHVVQNEEIKKKSRTTKLIKYGDEYYNNQEKRENTFLERYGVKCSSHCPEIFEKIQTSRYSRKELITEKGKLIILQGYEPQAYRKLESKYDDILHLKRDVPDIRYLDGTKEHRYYPDFFIPSINLIVEVKSDYTFLSNKRINLLKRLSCIDKGYEFQFIIYDKNMKEVEWKTLV